MSLVEAAIRRREQEKRDEAAAAVEQTREQRANPEPPLTLREALAAFEREFVLRALDRNRWNRRAAAREMGIGYSTLKLKMRVLARRAP